MRLTGCMRISPLYTCFDGIGESVDAVLGSSVGGLGSSVGGLGSSVGGLGSSDRDLGPVVGKVGSLDGNGGLGSVE